MTKYTSDAKPGRLLSLQENVSRLVQTLAGSPLTKDQSDSDAAATVEIPSEAVNQAIWAWRERVYYLPSEVVSDPSWAMLLELLRAELGHQRVSISRLCKISGVSTASAVRWIKTLESYDLVVRRVDPHNAEEEFAELTLKASSALRRYFRDVMKAH